MVTERGVAIEVTDTQEDCRDSLGPIYLKIATGQARIPDWITAEEARELALELRVAAQRNDGATDGASLIVAERDRQVSEEGWTPAHDDGHASGEIARAAACYADPPNAVVPPRWPWDDGWWKPSDDPVRNLVKAGALIAAEIDRLQRASGGEG